MFDPRNLALVGDLFSSATTGNGPQLYRLFVKWYKMNSCPSQLAAFETSPI